MSWIARSLANSLRIDDPHDAVRSSPPPPSHGDEDDAPCTPSHGRGVKEDLSELKQTLTKQLWGVASFLAPPPQPQNETNPNTNPNPNPDPDPDPDPDPAGASDSPRFAGIRSDFAEIGGRFRTGISVLSSNKAVEEISKIASSFLPFGEEEEEEEEEEGEGSRKGALGVTEEVMVFARNISMHPETWLDFPLLADEDGFDDFEMSNAQQEHALVVENLAPRLAALRIELCPSHMSERCFWKIYFVLLHPRLSKEDAERLSTPQIVEARVRLLQELQKRTKSEAESLGRSTSDKNESESSPASMEHILTAPSGGSSHDTPLATRAGEESSSLAAAPDFETEKHPVAMTEIKIVDKSVIGEQKIQDKNPPPDVPKGATEKLEDDGDEWLREDIDTIETGNRPKVTSIPIGNDEDVSFSDLEDEDDQSEPSHSKNRPLSSQSSATDSTDWVQLRKSTSEPHKDGKLGNMDTKDSNDWLDIDDFDEV